jgi:hypothetical protein
VVSPYSQFFRRPLLKVTLSLDLLHIQEHILTVHVLCQPSLSNLHQPSRLFPLEPRQQIRLLPHDVPAQFISHYPREQAGDRVFISLLEEFKRSLGPGVYPTGEEKLAKVWIPVVPKDNTGIASKEPLGVECIYPLSQILVEAAPDTKFPESRNTLGQHLKHGTHIRLEKRVQEVRSFIDGVVKERERTRMEMIHGKANGDGDVLRKKEAGDRTHLKRRRSSPPGEMNVMGNSKTVEDPRKRPNLRKCEHNSQQVASPLTNSGTTGPSKLGDDDDLSPANSSMESSVLKDSQANPAVSPTLPTPSGDQNPANHRGSRTNANTWSDLDFNLEDAKPSSRPSGSGNNENTNQFGPQSSSTSNQRKASDVEGESFDFTDDDFRFFDDPDEDSSLAAQGKSLGGGSLETPDNQIEDPPALESLSTSDSHGDEDEVFTPTGTSQGPDASQSERNYLPVVIQSSGIFDPIDFGTTWELTTKVLTQEEEMRAHRSPELEMEGDATSWRSQYDRKTHPKYSIMKMLRSGRSVLKKSSDLSTWTRSNGWKLPKKGERKRPFTVDLCSADCETWESPLDEEDIVSDSESDDTEDEVIKMVTEEESNLPNHFDGLTTNGTQLDVLERIPLSSLPLGPSLLHSCFHTDDLLKKAQPFSHVFPAQQSSGPAEFLQTSSPTSQPISAPTPVSPGAKSVDRIKSFESAANALAHEILGSISFFVTESEGRPPATAINYHEFVQLEDILQFAQLTKLSVKTILSSVSARQDGEVNKGGVVDQQLRLVNPPRLLIGQSQSRELFQLLPTATHYWVKLGLRPKSGSKDVRLFMVQSRNWQGDSDSSQMWLKGFQNLYQVSKTCTTNEMELTRLKDSAVWTSNHWRRAGNCGWRIIRQLGNFEEGDL